ncbi:chemotaxis protein CheW [Geobacter sp. DSM 9736]|uniref:chemotaxis protein CheW n=1 Tax=Geobacter sp. DSM 9736 TaxID=1277350 RepID=UPI000B50F8D1|nr:chemotaxis protein CheW [Geobacter sp. DSM 9736]SNB46533.1 purine-binding chemotaxis protein CheW [Geobacter sp. DSM 9736]
MAVTEVAAAHQYLTFRLDEEVFALEIGRVREVMDFTTVTRVPQCPDYMRGVINLRGNVVPVIDLRCKFGMADAEKTVNTCIIIVEMQLGGESLVLGAMADSVQEVIDLQPEEVEPAPRIGTRLDTDFITGMGKHSDGFIIILDIDRCFSDIDLAGLSPESAEMAVNG